MRPTCHTTVLIQALIAALAMIPTAAVACGGLFCDGGPAPIPVEQNAERVLFEVNLDGTISSTVEITYTGDPLDFAWVVPVPDTPELEVVPAEVLALLDDGTAPTLTGQPTRCGRSGSGCSTAGAADPFRVASVLKPVALAPAAILGCPMSGDDDDSAYDPVSVQEIDRVGPYDPAILSSEDPEALIDWLRTEGFFISEPMEPLIAEYALSGSKFLAMKLAPGAGVSDIAPIRMTYAGTNPQIPLVLTGVAAEPEMAIVAFIAGDRRYHAGNYANLLMDPAWLRYDVGGVDTNYYAVASWLADQVGGKAFFTEYAGPVTFTNWFGEAAEWLVDLQGRHSNLTRMFTRLSAWEMTEDPVFEPTDAGSVPAGIDLGGNEPIDACGPAPLGVCGATYCGPNALCAETDRGPGCVCPDGWVAREIEAVGAARGAGGRLTTCQTLQHVMYTTADITTEVSGPCSEGMCGDNGECVELNGFPTCDCDEGYAAVPGLDAPQCVPVIDVFGPEEALVNGNAQMGFAATEPSSTLRGAEVLVGLLILLIPGIVRARRRTP